MLATVTVVGVVGALAVLSALLGLGSPADLLRLVAVPAFAWAAYRDVRTRRIPNRLWPPLVGVGVLALALEFATGLPAGFEGDIALLRIAVSVGLVAPMGYVFFRIGGFGGADAKAVIALAVLFPLYPVYYLPFDALPMHAATLGVFSLTILTNTVIVGALYPAALAGRNLLRGQVAPPMVVGRPVPLAALATAHGSLMETPDGYTRRGLDLDALRMYLRWRGTTLSALRAAPDRHRDPTSLPPPGARNDPGDGAVADGPPVADGGTQGVETERERTRDEGASEPTTTAEGDAANEVDADDPWGAEAFLADIEGSAYGTSPEVLREGLDLLVEEDVVWISPGIPFLVPLFAGLVLSFTVGDVLFWLLTVVGLV